MPQVVKIFTGYLKEPGGHLSQKIGKVLEELINQLLIQCPDLTIQSITPVVSNGEDWTEYSLVVVFNSQEKLV